MGFWQENFTNMAPGARGEGARNESQRDSAGKKSFFGKEKGFYETGREQLCTWVMVWAR